jgi:hypothetical protein
VTRYRLNPRPFRAESASKGLPGDRCGADRRVDGGAEPVMPEKPLSTEMIEVAEGKVEVPEY